MVYVIGAGLAGTEAAWAAASLGAQVLLHEQRPHRQTAVHRTGDLAEIVCSNSLKSALLTNASGLLKAEMRRLGSVLLDAADSCAVPAGEALAVDREAFSKEVTRRVRSHPNVTLVRGEVQSPPDDRPLVIATGPLTCGSFAEGLAALTGRAFLHFYDAVAPTVTLESIDLTRAFRASRRGRELTTGTQEQASTPPTAAEGDDYLNCPFTREEYEAFHAALAQAEAAIPHNPEDDETRYFESCVPVEELARRGPRTLAFGPMRPIGLTDPRTGRRPYAVVQLRQENRDGTLWGLVGFQTRLTWPEQRRIFRLIPGLENAEFVRLGVMHRNTYADSPSILLPTLEMSSQPAVFLAGQITGVEGYMESAATGILAGINAVRCAQGRPGLSPPRETMLGSLLHHIVDPTAKDFTPMNANHGLLPPLPERSRDRKARGQAHADRSLSALDAWLASWRDDARAIP